MIYGNENGKMKKVCDYKRWMMIGKTLLGTSKSFVLKFNIHFLRHFKEELHNKVSNFVTLKSCTKFSFSKEFSIMFFKTFHSTVSYSVI